MITGLSLFLRENAIAQQEEAPKKEVTTQTTIKQNYRGIVQQSRLKDISYFGNVRENQLVGYGLIVGLNGSGDTLSSSPYTKESLTSMLERLGINIRDGASPSGKNIAAVMVTANLPSFARHGNKIDITVSALGDAKDLRGGTLLVTPLMGADGEVYAVAQGAVTVSGFNATGKAASETKGVPTSGKIANGAIVEKEIGFELAQLKQLTLSLANPDFTTAKRVAVVINEHFKKSIAQPLDSSTIQIALALEKGQNVVDFMTEIEQLNVEPDQSAKIVIDDKNGVIVVGHTVKISPIALTHGSITVRIVEKPQVYMPNPNTNVISSNKPLLLNTVTNTSNTTTSNNADQVSALQTKQQQEKEALDAQFKQQLQFFDNTYPNANQSQQQQQQRSEIVFAQTQQMAQLVQVQQQQMNQLQQQQMLSGIKSLQPTNDTQLVPVQQSTIVDQSKIDVREEKGKFTMLESGANLAEFVDALNQLGASAKDMSAILQTVKASGAMQAEIVMI